MHRFVCLLDTQKKIKKIEDKKYLGPPTPPEDESSFLFAGLLANPDMTLSHRGMT